MKQNTNFLSLNKLTMILVSTIGLATSAFAVGPVACSDKFDAESKFVSSTCVIFVTQKTYNGNLGGRSGADDKCNAEANGTERLQVYAQKGIQFKALLAWNNATVRGTRYYRAMDTIKVTGQPPRNSDGVTYIATAAGPNLARYLSNSILNVEATGLNASWVGLDDGNSRDEYASGRYTCHYWSDDRYKKTGGKTHDYYSYYAQPDENGYGWDNHGDSPCDHGKHLICVAKKII